MPKRFRYRPRVPLGVVKRLPWTRPSLMLKEISPSDTVLDLGCGPQSQLRICPVAHSVGVELFGPYLQAARELGTHHDYIQADVMKIDFKSDSFDVILGMDVLDNLEKDDAHELIARAKRWARKKIIVTVPNGWIPEGALDENPHQIHKSGYTTKDLEGWGFRVHGMNLKLPQRVTRLHEGQGLVGFLLNEAATYPFSLLTWHYPRMCGELVGILRIPESSPS